MNSSLPVIAAIPNYNMGEQLNELLPSLLSSGYDEVYVLDDGSIDDSREITQSISSDIHFVSGKENKGAGANRNRVLSVLGHEATIHFLDADITLETDRSAEVVAEAIPKEPFGFLGGLALTQDGIQSVWNYGPRQSLWSDAGAVVQNYLESMLTSNPEKASDLREKFSVLLRDWPNPLAEPVRRPVFWAIEQNLVVNSKTLSELGGFDESLREHEIQDLAIRMAHRGLKRYFDPSFVTTHKEVEVRNYNRRLEMLKAEYSIARKHGFKQWLKPDGILIPKL